MFNFFKKLKYTRNLIYANSDGNIIFSNEFPSDITMLIDDIVVNNMLYDDKVYRAIYKEYKRNYLIYDKHPYLLYFRIPLVIQAQYVHRNLIEPEQDSMNVAFIINAIPEPFRIPKYTKDLIMECLQKSSAYMTTKEKIDEEDFEKYLEFKFLSEWPTYIKNPDKYVTVFSTKVVFTKFIQAGGDNYRTISNIIERTIQSKMQGAASN